MTVLDEALLHLAKAREILDAPEASRDLGLANAAASNSVISTINSKDAICLTLTGKPGRKAVESAPRIYTVAGGVAQDR